MLAGWFRQARLEKGWTIQQVADSLKIDFASVSRFESGHRLPTKEQLVRLAQLYNKEVNEWMVYWLMAKIEKIIQDEPMGKRALEQLLADRNTEPKSTPSIEDMWAEIQRLKNQIQK